MCHPIMCSPPPSGVLPTSLVYMPCAGLAAGRRADNARACVCAWGCCILPALLHHCLPCCATACRSPSLSHPTDEGLCVARVQNSPQLSLPQSTQQCSGPSDGHSVQVSTHTTQVAGWMDGWMGGWVGGWLGGWLTEQVGEWVSGLGQLVGLALSCRNRLGQTGASCAECCRSLVRGSLSPRV